MVGKTPQTVHYSSCNLLSKHLQTSWNHQALLATKQRGDQKTGGNPSNGSISSCASRGGGVKLHSFHLVSLDGQPSLEFNPTNSSISQLIFMRKFVRRHEYTWYIVSNILYYIHIDICTYIYICCIYIKYTENTHLETHFLQHPTRYRTSFIPSKGGKLLKLVNLIFLHQAVLRLLGGSSHLVSG